MGIASTPLQRARQHPPGIVSAQCSDVHPISHADTRSFVDPPFPLPLFFYYAGLEREVTLMERAEGLEVSAVQWR